MRRIPSTLLILSLVCSLVFCALGGLASPTSVHAQTPAPDPTLRIADATGQTPVVVNEGKQTKLQVLGVTSERVPVTAWSLEDSAVARVSRRGKLKGLLYGFTTIRATTADGRTAVGYAAVVRFGDVRDTGANGDAKTDTSGNFYLTSPRHQVVYKIGREGGDEVFAGKPDDGDFQDGVGQQARLNTPTGLGIDNRANGGLYVADTQNHCIRRISFRGAVTVAVGAPETPGTMVGDETPLDEAVFRSPRGVASVGTSLYVADTDNHAVYYVDRRTERVTLIAGSPGEEGETDGAGRSARFRRPSGIAANADGTLLAVADSGNGVVRLIEITVAPNGARSGVVTTLGAGSSTRDGAPEAAPPAGAFRFDAPHAVAFDRAGNVYVADSRSASVVTRAPGRASERVALAQPGSLVRPQSFALSGADAFILDEVRAAKSRVRVATVGPPRIESVDPRSSPLAGGGEVTVVGRNFSPDLRVVLGDAEVVDVTVETSRRLRFRVPPQQATGGRTLSVATRGGLAQTIFHIRPPRLDEIAPGFITTVAGGGLPYLGDGGDATLSMVGLDPVGIAVDAAGNLYVADAEHNRVRRIDAQTHVITTVAGTGASGFSGDGGIATAARLDGPTEVALDGAGNLFVADTNNHRIRRVDVRTRQITTVAGSGPVGADNGAFGGDGGPATSARLNLPYGVACDAAGNLYFADALNYRVRRVDAASGTITTVAGKGTPFYEADGPATATGLAPRGVAVDGGSLLIVNESRVHRLNLATGTIVTVAGSAVVTEASGDGGPATSAGIANPTDVCVDAGGNLYISHRNRTRGAAVGEHRVRRVDAQTGVITTVAGDDDSGFSGDGGPATAASLSKPAGVAVDGAGNLYVADQGNHRLRRIGLDGRIATIAGTAEVTPSGDGDLATSARFDTVWRIAVAPARGVTVLDSMVVPQDDDVAGYVPAVRRVDPDTGEIRLLAIASQDAVALAADATERTYLLRVGLITRVDGQGSPEVPIAGNGIPGNSGDGGPATAASITPGSLAVDGAANIFFVQDSTSIRRVDAATGVITTVAGNGQSGNGPDGGLAHETSIEVRAVAVDGPGNLYIVDSDGHIRRVDAATNVITTVATLPAGVETPGIALSPYGWFVLDLTRMDVLLVTFDGRVLRVTGANGAGVGGDGGPAADAIMSSVRDIATDSAGNLYVVDEGARVVRAVRVFVP